MNQVDKLIQGKATIWCETRTQAERLIKQFHAKGVKGGYAVEAGHYTTPCGFGIYSGDPGFIYMCDRKDFVDKKYFPSPVIPFADDEVLVAKREDDSIHLVHKLNGKVVKQESVTRYHADPDNFLKGVQYGVEKMQGGARNAAPAYKIGDIVRCHCRDGVERVGKVESIDETSNYPYTVSCGAYGRSNDDFSTSKEANKAADCVCQDYIIGYASPLASQAPTTPLASQAPRFYQKGDKVLVRDDLVVGKRYGKDTWVDEMIHYVGKVITLKGQPYTGVWRIQEHNYNWAPEMFVGKIVPRGELKVGDEVLVKQEYPKGTRSDSTQHELRGKVITITRGADMCGHAYAEGTLWGPALRFAGKLVRPPKQGYSVGDMVCVAKSNVTNGPYIGKVIKVGNGEPSYLVQDKNNQHLTLWCYTDDVLGLAATDGRTTYYAGDKLFMRKGWCHEKPFIGEITQANSYGPYKVEEPDGGKLWQFNEDIIGRAL